MAGAARPLLLSGDCSAGLAVTAGLQRRHREIAVVWLDAHGDFNTPAITISGYLGGMPVAMLTGRAPKLFADPLGLRPVPEHNIVLADARDLDPAERDALAASQVRRIPATAGACQAALSGLRDLPVYLHVDVNILDSTEVPGLRFPAGPGPTLGDVGNCLTAIAASATSARHPSPAPGSPARSAGRPRETRSPGWPARSAPGSPGHQETSRPPPPADDAGAAQPDQPGAGVQKNKGAEVLTIVYLGLHQPSARIPSCRTFPST